LAQWQARFAEIKFELRLRGEVDAIGERSQDAIHRIVQEALSNAVRHARPREVTVSLCACEDLAELSVIDDGRAMARGERAGMGMQTMRERAAGAGGTLVVEQGDDGQGWRVRARLPLFETP
jgi:signal transduction histidine kinase